MRFLAELILFLVLATATVGVVIVSSIRNEAIPIFIVMIFFLAALLWTSDRRRK